MLPLGLALGASLAWGASDFLAGIASRRAAVLTVLLGAQVVGLALALPLWLLADRGLPAGEVAAASAVAGVAEVVGFALLYRGLALGQMCVVAPLGALTAVLPVGVAVAAGDSIGGLAGVGMALAVLATALAAWEPGSRRLADGAALGLGAALAFGVFFVALGEASEGGGVAAVVLARTASVGVLVLAAVLLRPTLRVEAPVRGAVAALGALDLLANLGFSLAAAQGADAPVAVLASVYPLTTVLLARTLLGERLGRVRLAGVTGVLCGVALISLGTAV